MAFRLAAGHSTLGGFTRASLFVLRLPCYSGTWNVVKAKPWQGAERVASVGWSAT